MDPKDRQNIGQHYRTAQVFHQWAMEVFEVMVIPAYVTGGEYFVIFAMFLLIRINFTEPYLPVITGSIGVICFVVLKLAIEYAARLADASAEFGKPRFSVKGTKLSKYDRAFLRSCRPLLVKVGKTFKISRDTFPTISQDIIMSGLINLLLTFK